MSVQWKKILFSGEVDLTSADVTGNQKDLVGGDGIKLTGGGDNVLLGADGDVDLSVDIMNTALYPSADAVDVNNDYLLIHDHSQGASQGVTSLRRVNVSKLIQQISAGVSAITFSGDASGSTDISITSTGTVNFAGGTNQPISFGSSSAGGGTISATLDSASITGGAGSSSNLFSSRGVASFHSNNFEHDPSSQGTRIQIKADGVGATEIEDGSISNTHVAANAGITDDKLATINDTHKVDSNALDIENATALGSGSISSQDLLLLHDTSENIGAGAFNYAASVGDIQSFINANIGGIANAHPNLSAPANVDEGGLVYVSDVTFDQYGHVTDIDTDTVQTATTTAAGIVNVGVQEFGGHKTFDRITISDDSSINGAGDLLVEGNTVINGDLTVSGATTTLNVATLNVEDATIVGAVPEDAYDTNQTGINDARNASAGGGFFLNSHTGTGVDKFAGFQWKGLAAPLTGWSVQNTADNSDVSAISVPVAVMEFGSSAPTTAESAGVGSFFIDTTSNAEALYIRVS